MFSFALLPANSFCENTLVTNYVVLALVHILICTALGTPNKLAVWIFLIAEIDVQSLGECKVDCPRSFVYIPVCSSDNKTFANEEDFKCRQILEPHSSEFISKLYFLLFLHQNTRKHLIQLTFSQWVLFNSCIIQNVLAKFSGLF